MVIFRRDIATARTMLTIILFASYLTDPLSAVAQIRQTAFQTLQINGETPYDPSFTLTIDPFGFLWIGTVGGLLKYDGVSLQSYQHVVGDSFSLPSNLLFNVHSDRKGNIYAESAGEPLYMLNRTNSKFYQVRTAETIIDDAISMISDTANTTWIGTGAGICSCVLQDRQRIPSFQIQCPWPTSHPLQRLQNKTITALAISRHNDLWIGTDDGLYKINPYRLDRLDTLVTPKDFFVRDLFVSEQGDVYVLSNGTQRLWKTDVGKKQPQPVSGLNTHLENTMLYGAIDINNTIWVSELGFGMHSLTSDGVSTYFSQDQNSSTVLSDKYLRKPVTDYAGNIWWPGDVVYKFAAFHKEVFVWSERFRNLSTVSSIYREGDILWIGTLGGGLLKYKFSTGTYQQFDQNSQGPTPLPDERVYFISPRGPDSLILLTRGYLVFFHKASGRCKRYPISNGPIRSAVIEESGAWLTHSGAGIFYLNFATGEKEAFLDGKNGQPIIAQSYFIFKDDSGTLWLCTLGNGLVKFNPRTLQAKTFQKKTNSDNGISSNNLHMITADKTGLLWIATTEGLNVFDPKTEQFSVLTSKDGMTADLIHGLSLDQDGNLWATAGSGLNMINTSTKDIRAFGFGEGLTKQQYYPRAIHIDAEGRVYIGGSAGLNFFHPSKLGSNLIAPQVWISDIRRPDTVAYDKSIEMVDHITLAHSEDFVTITFASTHFTDPEGNTFQYRMRGLDDRWIDLGSQKSLTLAGLQPGDYTLQVSTATRDGISAIEPASLRITVEPPFYKTMWFMIIVFVFFTSLIIALSRYRIVQLRKEAEYKQKLSQIELQALRSQMNPHFIFNSLNSIKSYIASNEPRMATNYLTKFAQLMRHILNHSKAEQISLAEELKALQLYIELERIRFDGKFSFDLTVDPDLDISQIAIQPLIIQPFVENAIRHGLVHLDRPGRLAVRVKDQNGSVLVEIEDNGVGRKAAGQMNSKTADMRKSYGVEITKDRLQTKYQDQSRLEIIDLTNGTNEPVGTLVKVQIPKLTLS